MPIDDRPPIDYDGTIVRILRRAHDDPSYLPGISRWDYYFASAVSGVIANTNLMGTPREVAEMAAMAADEMAIERDRRWLAATSRVQR